MKLGEFRGTDGLALSLLPCDPPAYTDLPGDLFLLQVEPRGACRRCSDPLSARMGGVPYAWKESVSPPSLPS